MLPRSKLGKSFKCLSRLCFEMLEKRLNLDCEFAWEVLVDGTNPDAPVCEPQFGVQPGIEVQPGILSDSVWITSYPGQAIVLGDRGGELTVNGFTRSQIHSEDYSRAEAMFPVIPLAGAIKSLQVTSNNINLSALTPLTFGNLNSTSLILAPYLKEISPGNWIQDGRLEAVGSFAADWVSVAYTSHKQDAEDLLVTSEYNQVEVFTLDGNDVVEATSKLRGTISTGAGRDTVYVNDAFFEEYGVEHYRPGDTVWNIEGVGSGLAVAASGETLTYVGMEEIEFDLGDGNDSASLKNLAGLAGALSIKVNGATGTDTINASQAGSFRLLLSSGGEPTLPDDQEVVIGGAGDDRISGGNGRDRLIGGDGNDHVHGEGGDDELRGGDGVDTLFGGSGDDIIHGDDDNDVIHIDESGIDENYGDAGDDEFQLDPDSGDSSGPLDRKTDGGAGVNHLWVSATKGGHQYALDDIENSKLALYLAGTIAAELEYVQAAFINAGDDLLPDVFTLHPIADPEDFDENELGAVVWSRRPTASLPKLTIVFNGSGGSSTVNEETTALKYQIDSKEIFDAFLIFGGNEADTVTGGQTSMVVLAAGGKDAVAGSKGNDLILGMNGDDALTGGGGDDQLVGNAGNDKLGGGDNDDWLIDQFPGMWQVVEGKVPAALLPAFRDKVGSSRLALIQAQLELEGGSNEFFGNDGDDVIIGGTGADTALDGGDGSDVILGEGFQFDSSLTFSASYFDNYFNALSISDQGEFKLSAKIGISPLQGSKDIIRGGDGFDILLGGNGDDEIDAGLGSSIIFGDSISIELARGELNFSSDGDSQTATANYRLLPSISRAGSGNDTITAGSTRGQGGERPYFNIVVGGDGADRIYGGDAYVDFLFGNNGNDPDIDGNKDDLENPGIDIMVGGAGDDTLRGGNFANLLIGDSFDIEGFANLDWESIKNLTFNVGFELVPIDSGADHIYGGSGFDFIAGGDGDDEISGNPTTDEDLNIVFGDAFTWKVSAGFHGGDEYAESKQAGIGSDPTSALDLVRSKFALAGSGNDVYTGGNGVDVVFGGLGNDILRGGAGWDFLVGEGGDDTLNGGPGWKFHFEDEKYQAILGGPGNDTLIGGDDPDWLESEAGNDIFHGGGGNDIIYGGADADQLYGEDGDDQLFGEDGADLLAGGTGDDVLTGGPGIDWFDGGAGTNTIVDPDGVATINLSRSTIFRNIPAAWVASLKLPMVDTGLEFTLSDTRFVIREHQLYLRAGQSVGEASGAILFLNVTAQSSGVMLAAGSFALIVENAPADWQFAYQWNPNPTDVNADGTTSPLDALLIINLLNVQRGLELTPAVGGTRAPYFFDTSGDNHISPLDALLVINRLNVRGSGEASLEASTQGVLFVELSFDWLVEKSKRRR